MTKLRCSVVLFGSGRLPFLPRSLCILFSLDVFVFGGRFALRAVVRLFFFFFFCRFSIDFWGPSVGRPFLPPLVCWCYSLDFTQITFFFVVVSLLQYICISLSKSHVLL